MLLQKKYFFNKTPAGEFMIEAYNYYDPLSAADVIVFAEGTIESPIITRIVKINSTNNQVIEDARFEIYAFERRGLHSKAGGLLNIYTRINSRWLNNGRGSSNQNASNNNQLGAKRSRSEITANPVVKSKVNEDEGTVTYKNGDVATVPWGEGKASRELDFIDYINEQADAKRQMSNRELLANAPESAVRNDIEAKKLAEYKSNINKMNAQSKKLAELKSEMKELSFSKGQRDKERIKEIRDEIIKTENRIHNYDKKLLGLEAKKAISDIIAREKSVSLSALPRMKRFLFI